MQMKVLNKAPKVLMIGPSPDAMGGIATIADLYMKSDLTKLANVTYIASYSDGSKFKKAVLAIRAYIVYIFLLLFESPNIIHVHSSAGASFYRKMLFLMIAKVFRKKTIFHLNASNFMRFYDQSIINRFFVRRTLNRVDRIWVLAMNIKKNIQECTNNRNIGILYNPVSPFTSFSKTPPNGKPLEVLFMGRLGQRKGVYDLLEAFPLVLHEYPMVRLVLCGDGEVEKVRELCKEKKIAEQVEVTGWITGSQKLAYFKKGAIYVLPSYHEALPLSILEAMVAGLPVISTSIAGIPDAIEEGVNGYLVEPGNVTDLAGRIVKLLKDEQLRINIGNNNKKKVKEIFDIDNIVKKVFSKYQSLLLQ